jgi:nucleoside-diphosphate-sugar epimerase
MNDDVLILGGSHFVGRAVVERFQQLGRDVTVLNRGTTPMKDTEQLVADRNDLDTMANALHRRTFDVVVDCSGYSASHVQAAVDVVGERVAHWIHVSTAAVYNIGTTVPAGETQPAVPSPAWGAYAANKASADQWLLTSPIAERLTIFRPPYIFGANNTIDRERFVWRRLLAGRPVLVPGSGETVVQFVHADDLARAVELASEAATGDPAVYNLGSTQGLTLSAWVALLADVSDTRANIISIPHGDKLDNVPYFPFSDVTLFVDTTAIRTALQWEPVDLRTRFAETFVTIDDHTLQPGETALEDDIVARFGIS